MKIHHFRYGFADSHAFGGKAGQDISLRVAGQGNEGFRIFQSLFHKQVHIPSVAIDNHGTVVKQLGQAVAAVQVVVHDFHLHVVRDILGGAYGNPASTHNHHQAAGDRQILAKQLNISPHQLSYVTHSGEGEGLLFYGNTILPFIDHFPKDTELYRVMTTKPQEVASA